MSNNRKRAIRALMAETGLKYTQAMRELDRRREAANTPTGHPASETRRCCPCGCVDGSCEGGPECVDADEGFPLCTR